MIDFEIRYADEKDLERVIELEGLCFSGGEIIAAEIIKWIYEKAPKCFLVAYVTKSDNENVKEGEIIAALYGRPWAKRLITDEIFEINEIKESERWGGISLMVDERCRGNGIARRFFADAIEIYKKNGFKKFSLTCKDHLIDFYGSIGFVLVGESASKIGGEVWNDMVIE